MPPNQVQGMNGLFQMKMVADGKEKEQREKGGPCWTSLRAGRARQQKKPRPRFHESRKAQGGNGKIPPNHPKRPSPGDKI